MDQQKIWDFHQNRNASGNVFDASLPRYRFLAGQIPRGARVLNIGVGKGGLEAELVKRGCEVYALDPSEESIAHLRDALDLGERARVGVAEHMPYGSDELDVVIMSEVLEHLTSEVIQRSLTEVLRVLKGGGLFLGTVPADEELQNSQCVCPDCGKIFHRWGHLQSFSKEGLAGILDTRFSSISVERRHFSDRSRLNAVGKLVSVVKFVALMLGRGGSNDTFVFRARA